MSMQTDLATQVRWLRQCAKEIADEGHFGWGNTCLGSADAIEKWLPEILAQQSRIETLQADSDRYKKALKIIADWELPDTGKWWPESGAKMGYESLYGSNGARSWMRLIAGAAMRAASGGEVAK
jgi:hypothetical protein